MGDVESLKSKRYHDQSVVRIMAAQIPASFSPALGVLEFFGGHADHMWFEIKRAGSRWVSRWEVLHFKNKESGHVHIQAFNPGQGFGAGSAYIVAEVVGAEAEAIGNLIEAEARNYGCREKYVAFPGPNSNGFVKYFADRAGWIVDFPFAALGTNTKHNITAEGACVNSIYQEDDDPWDY